MALEPLVPAVASGLPWGVTPPSWFLGSLGPIVFVLSTSTSQGLTCYLPINTTQPGWTSLSSPHTPEPSCDPAGGVEAFSIWPAHLRRKQDTESSGRCSLASSAPVLWGHACHEPSQDVCVLWGLHSCHQGPVSFRCFCLCCCCFVLIGMSPAALLDSVQEGQRRYLRLLFSYFLCL